MSEYTPTCGYTVLDADGIEEPCDRPATGWRWYQDVRDHEDLLDEACDWHANEGGRRIHAADALREGVRALADGMRTQTGKFIAADLDAPLGEDS